mmetsp:Transcript_24439/g.58840  ORF Transcript_24439/g.58840 Transcript_24439/m.58840 type:complete len:331 (-) Transcript_24439:319-1311(-)
MVETTCKLTASRTQLVLKLSVGEDVLDSTNVYLNHRVAGKSRIIPGGYVGRLQLFGQPVRRIHKLNDPVVKIRQRGNARREHDDACSECLCNNTGKGVEVHEPPRRDHAVDEEPRLLHLDGEVQFRHGAILDPTVRRPSRRLLEDGAHLLISLAAGVVVGEGDASIRAPVAFDAGEDFRRDDPSTLPASGEDDGVPIPPLRHPPCELGQRQVHRVDKGVGVVRHPTLDRPTVRVEAQQRARAADVLHDAAAQLLPHRLLRPLAQVEEEELHAPLVSSPLAGVNEVESDLLVLPRPDVLVLLNDGEHAGVHSIPNPKGRPREDVRDHRHVE